jgi:hypothetical protein
MNATLSSSRRLTSRPPITFLPFFLDPTLLPSPVSPVLPPSAEAFFSFGAIDPAASSPSFHASFSCFPDEVACKSRVCLRLSRWRRYVRRVLFGSHDFHRRLLDSLRPATTTATVKARCPSLRCSALCCFSPPTIQREIRMEGPPLAGHQGGLVRVGSSIASLLPKIIASLPPPMRLRRH